MQEHFTKFDVDFFYSFWKNVIFTIRYEILQFNILCRNVFIQSYDVCRMRR